jgi:hypothetical protein
MEYVKNVVQPIRQVAPRHILRGLQEDYGHLTADVVLLAGEVHYERKPVSYGATPNAHAHMAIRGAFGFRLLRAETLSPVWYCIIPMPRIIYMSSPQSSPRV